NPLYGNVTSVSTPVTLVGPEIAGAARRAASRAQSSMLCALASIRRSRADSPRAASISDSSRTTAATCARSPDSSRAKLILHRRAQAFSNPRALAPSPPITVTSLPHPDRDEMHSQDDG